MFRKLHRFIPLYLVFIFAADCFAEDSAAVNTPENWAQMLSGQVESIMEYSGEDLDSLTLRRKIQFNDQNQPETETLYNDDGVIKSRNIYSYTDQQKVSEICGMNADGVQTWKYSYTYDENQNLTEEVSADSEGEIEWRETYHYNDQGLLTEKNNYNADGSVNLQDTYQYNDQSKLSGRTTLFGDGRVLKRVSYYYNEDGLQTKEERYDANGLYETVNFTYNGDKLISQTVVSNEGVTKRESRYSYNGDGSLLMEHQSTPDTSFELNLYYIYDENGNWIRKWEKSGQYTLRTIDYSEE